MSLLIDKSSLNIKETLTWGQTFRFLELDKGFRVFSRDRAAFCFEEGDKVRIETDDEEYFFNYFDLNTDYDGINEKLGSFEELKNAVSTGRGIRLLRQDPFETVISFIISSNNNIPRIKKIIERICVAAGTRHGDYYGFPDRRALLNLTESDFESFGAGYRAKFLVDAVKIADETFLNELTGMDTSNALEKLMEIKGVGKKVADCIALFGLAKWDVFPVDTWMEKALLSDKLDTREKIRNYYVNRYGKYAGLAQQYVFHYRRNVIG